MKYLLLLFTILCAFSSAAAETPDSGQSDFLFIQERAEAGDPEAQFSLALMLDHGDGVNQDTEKALYWLMKAAEQNLAGACLYLGIKYESGNTVGRDVRLASRWYTAAARQDWPTAQYLLGMLHLKGERTVQAYAWLSLAAQHDYHAALEEVNRIRPLLSDRERQKAEEFMLQSMHREPSR